MTSVPPATPSDASDKLPIRPDQPTADSPLPRELSYNAAVSQHPPQRQGLVSRSNKLWRLARKELRESLRDRRTLFTLVLMPILVYPLLGLVVQKFAISGLSAEAPVAIVVFDEAITEGQQLEILSTTDESLWPGAAQHASPPPDMTQSSADAALQPDGDPVRQSAVGSVQAVAAPADKTKAEEKLSSGDLINSLTSASDISQTRHRLEIKVAREQIPGDRIEDIVASGMVDIGLRWHPSEWNDQRGRPTTEAYEVIYRRGDSLSVQAADKLERQLRNLRERYTRQLLRDTGLGSQWLRHVASTGVAPQGRRVSPLESFVPLMLVLMTMTGAVYPAIDLTAGERERGTLEMLIASPVPRRQILTAKFIAVTVVALLTAIVNLVAMVVTVYSANMASLIFAGGVSFTMLLQVFTLLAVFATFFSAVLLCITSFARSFREAQAWLIPLMLISLAPGILSLMPNIRLTLWLSLVPLVNIVLLGRELLQGSPSLPLFAVTLAATAGYAMIALHLAGKIFGTDAILYGSSGNDSGGLLKRPSGPTEIPSVAFVLKLSASIVTLFLFLSGVRNAVMDPANMTAQLLFSGGVTLLVFGGMPLAGIVWNRARLRRSLALCGSNGLVFAGAVLLGLSLWTVAYESFVIAGMPDGFEKLAQLSKELSARLTQTPLPLRLISLALLPAVCEEVFFRGLLLTSLKGSQRSTWQAILISTALFAAMHAIVGQELFPGRIVPTFLLGLVLAVIRVRTGSILPGIVLHSLNNALMLSLSEMTPVLTLLGLDQDQATHLPGWFLAISGTVAFCGMTLIFLATRQRQRSPSDGSSVQNSFA